MQNTFGKEKTTIVKGLAVLLLLMYHLFENESLVMSMQVDFRPFQLADFLVLTGYGNICVSLFVFITAYGISVGILADDKTSIKDCYGVALRRMTRLMKNFFVMYVSINLLWHHYFDYKGLYGEGAQGALYALTDSLGMAMFFDTPTLNMTWWYMEVAYILIFVVPLLVCGMQKLGYPMIAFSFLLPSIVTMNYDVERYLLVATVGVAMAYGKWFEKISGVTRYPLLRWCVTFGVLLLSVPIRQNYAIQQEYLHVIDAVLVLLWTYFGGILLPSIPIVRVALAYIGKHSMNIYLVHTFFYMALWQKYIYQFRYAPLIVIVLLVSCLMYSVLLEVVKSAMTRFYSWCKMKKNMV